MGCVFADCNSSAGSEASGVEADSLGIDGDADLATEIGFSSFALPPATESLFARCEVFGGVCVFSGGISIYSIGISWESSCFCSGTKARSQ
ncbi:hypothetical protein [Chlorogloeopsis sp. ULAP02]|uniref:hypothetical protein n=1 Tax=Chlorogloeopsis sp. ULAP02 TaxID=3107926 RepID=UPI003137484A